MDTRARLLECIGQPPAAILVLPLHTLVTKVTTTGCHRREQRSLPLDLVDEYVDVGQVGLGLAAEGVGVHGVHSGRLGAMPDGGSVAMIPSMVHHAPW